MRHRIAGVLLAIALASAAVTPASAANKEHQQLMADIRMLQEQAQILQNMIGSLNEAIKAVNTRLDDQSNAVRKAFADQKLLIDNLSSDLRVVREKVDDNNVRIASMTQELDALRRSMQQATMPRPSTTDPAGTSPPGVQPPPSTSDSTQPLAPGASPKQLYDAAFGDYTAGQWDLAIQGFEAYLRTFPKSEQASQVQLLIGKSYDFAGNKTKALEAYDKVIRDYPNGSAIPDAYFYKGVVLLDLKQPDKAREMFETVAKNYPTSAAASLARQRLEQLKKH
jgi:tol-pal system protein YbgF